MTYKELAYDIGCSRRTLNRIVAILGIFPHLDRNRKTHIFTPSQIARIRAEKSARYDRMVKAGGAR